MNTLLILFIYFIGFTDKQGSTEIALSERSLQQREKWGIAIDSLDYAVSPIYLDSIKKLGAKVMHTSRWMNGATISFDEGKGIQEKLEACSFVDFVELTRDDTSPASAPEKSISQRKRLLEKTTSQDEVEYGEEYDQLNVFNLYPLHDMGFMGQGIHIAIIDGGFWNTDVLECFKSTKKQILGTYDFTDEETNIYRDTTGGHGTMCFSTIAANTDSYKGAATQANYYLIRTEETITESPKEMDNLIAGFELADSLGANIVSASLGYTEFDNSALNLTYNDLDGQTLRVSRAATIAARKGMLICTSQGNEGFFSSWHYLSAPADADSILSVGAVDRYGEVAIFSSYGPAADSRIKPDVCAMGHQTIICLPYDGRTSMESGTSLSCPLIAGLAACLWSALPWESAMQIRDRIMRSANHYNNPDDRFGYGIPDAEVAYNFAPTAIRAITNDDKTNNVQKLLIDGRLYIVRNGHTYNLQGIEVEMPK